MGDRLSVIRPLRKEEIALLRDFLYEAIFIPEGVEAPPKSVVDLPELRLYIEDFGKRTDDLCLVAECDGKVVGAVWTRIMNDYGHVDDQTPSLSISLYEGYRNKGIGGRLMKEMLSLLAGKGYGRVSLSVQKANYAVRMYLKLGFRIIRETEEEYVMVKELEEPAYSLRFLSEKDIPEMMVLFRTTVLHVNSRDYTSEEVEDWASCGSERRFRQLLPKHCFVGALDKLGHLVGFSSMNRDGYLHSLFVHEAWQGKGVATFLLSEVERIAREYEVDEISSEVSLTAQPFFEKRGYEVVKEQKEKANKLWLTNFVMRKKICPPDV